MKKKYHLNKKEILFWANKVRRYLNLPKINIIIYKILNPYKCKDEISFTPDLKRINLVQPLKDFIIDRGTDNIYIQTNNSKDLLISAIFHEFAHYFQWYYYRKWFDKYSSFNNYVKFDGKHCDKHIERNANKIAMILFKRLYKS